MELDQDDPKLVKERALPYNKIRGCACFCAAPVKEGPVIPTQFICVTVNECVISTIDIDTGKDVFELLDPNVPPQNPSGRPFNPILFLQQEGGERVWPPGSGKLFLPKVKVIVPIFANAENQTDRNSFYNYKLITLQWPYIETTNALRLDITKESLRVFKVDRVLRRALQLAEVTVQMWVAAHPCSAPNLTIMSEHWKAAPMGELPANTHISQITELVIKSLQPKNTPSTVMSILGSQVLCPACAIEVCMQALPEHCMHSHPDQEQLLLCSDWLGSNVRAAQTLVLDVMARTLIAVKPSVTDLGRSRDGLLQRLEEQEQAIHENAKQESNLRATLKKTADELVVARTAASKLQERVAELEAKAEVASHERLQAEIAELWAQNTQLEQRLGVARTAAERQAETQQDTIRQLRQQLQQRPGQDPEPKPSKSSHSKKKYETIKSTQKLGKPKPEKN